MRSACSPIRQVDTDATVQHQIVVAGPPLKYAKDMEQITPAPLVMTVMLAVALLQLQLQLAWWLGRVWRTGCAIPDGTEIMLQVTAMLCASVSSLHTKALQG